MRDVVRTGPVIAAAGVPDARQKSCEPPSFMVWIVGLGALLVILAGCAGARVTQVSSTKPAGMPPAAILVEVSTAPAIEDTQAKLAEEVAAKLQSDLLQHLKEAGITAEPFAAGTSHPGAAVLHVSITEAEPGSFIERFVIGFGLGRSELQAKVDLESVDTAAAQPMTAFETSSASGRIMPGLILPASIALATRDVVPLAIGGGIKVATSFRGGLDTSGRNTAKAVVDQLKKYYASVGWRWPANDNS